MYMFGGERGGKREIKCFSPSFARRRMEGGVEGGGGGVAFPLGLTAGWGGGRVSRQGRGGLMGRREGGADATQVRQSTPAVAAVPGL